MHLLTVLMAILIEAELFEHRIGDCDGMISKISLQEWTSATEDK
jgi:hypothetical protein